MRVLFLSRGENELRIGGIAEVIFQLSHILPKFGIEVFTYTGSNQPIQPFFNQLTERKHFSGPFIRPGLKEIFKRSKQLEPLIELVKALKIDIIHTCGIYKTGFVAMHIKKKLGIPYVLTSHGDILVTSSERIKRESVRKRCQAILKNADAVTHLTHEMATMAHGIYDCRYKSYIIPNGIDLDIWQKEHTENKNKSSVNYLLAIGRLVPEKGFDTLIEAFKLLLDRKKCHISLVIAGVGPSEKLLFQKAQALGLNAIYHKADLIQTIPEQSVCFTGYVEGISKIKLYSQSRLVLFATQPHLTEEAFGLVPFETFAAKKRLIASPLSRIKQLKSSGFHIEMIQNAANPDQWADQIQMLLTEKIDNSIIENNFNLLHPFDWKLIAKQYHDVYITIMDKKESADKPGSVVDSH